MDKLAEPSDSTFLRLALVACAGVGVDGALELDGISGAGDSEAFPL